MKGINQKHKNKYRDSFVDETNIPNWAEYWPDVTDQPLVIKQAYEYLKEQWDRGNKVNLGPNITEKLSYIYCYIYEVNTRFMMDITKENYEIVFRKYRHILDSYKEDTLKIIPNLCSWAGQMAYLAKLPMMQKFWFRYANKYGREGDISFQYLSTIIYREPSKHIDSDLFLESIGIESRLSSIAKPYQEEIIPYLKKEVDSKLKEKGTNFLNVFGIKGRQYPGIMVNGYGIDFDLRNPLPCTYKLNTKKVNQLVKNAENCWREDIGLPKIGEGWINETLLFKQLQETFKQYQVVHHGKPAFLGRQHYDIYFPKFKIALEYQGEQHNRPIDYFGGEEKFKENQARDQRKKKISLENDVKLIYVMPEYNIYEIIKKISNIIGINQPELAKINTKDLKGMSDFRKFRERKGNS